MIEKTKYIITQDQGQFLMATSASELLGEGHGFPQKLGDKTFNERERALNIRDINRMYEVLKRKSPNCIRLRMLQFGPPENWVDDVIFSEKGPIPLKKLKAGTEQTEVSIEFDRYSLWGAKWCLFLAAHPESPLVKSPTYQAEIVWPLAQELRSVKWLERMTGLDGAALMEHELDADPEDVEEKKVESDPEKKQPNEP